MRTQENLIELQGTQENLWEPVGTRGNLWEPVRTHYLIEALLEEEIEQKAQKML